MSALIVAAELDGASFEFLDELRRAHFPPERNHLTAHLTLFHALPPSSEGEARRVLGGMVDQPAPLATIEAPYSLGNGVAFRIRSEELDNLRAEIADHFHGSLTAQDAAGFRAHVTIQNKVPPAEAKTLLHSFRDFAPRSASIVAITLNRYLGGPWERIARYPFRG